MGFVARLPLRLATRLSPASSLQPQALRLLASHEVLVQHRKMSSDTCDRYLLSFYVPSTHTQKCTSAIFTTGAGTWPGATYGETCFTLKGTGQFRPLAGADPNIGTVGELERVEEDKVEMIVFGKDTVVEAVKVLKNAHPYEVVAYFVTRTEDI